MSVQASVCACVCACACACVCVRRLSADDEDNVRCFVWEAQLLGRGVECGQ